ncbi:MAG: extracellular solute-binding protein [Lachnospiraceae bacterium]|nr:extracellular solute-binding protein [Lachnospiraceae bacterium]
MKKRSRWKKYMAGLLCFSVLASPVQITARAEAEETATEYDPFSIIYDAMEYEDYLESHKNAGYPIQEIVIEGGSFLEAPEGTVVLGSYEGYTGNAVLTPEEGDVTWEVEIPESGFYNIELTYYPTEGKNNTIERALYINGEIPFQGAQYLEFSRVWEDETGIYLDSRDNEVRPKQIEAPEWRSAYAMDSNGFYTRAYQFYFEKGSSRITLSAAKEPVIIGNLTLKQQETLPSYEEYLEGWKAAGAEDAQTENIKIQGEAAAYKSDSTLYPVTDRTSPLTEPASARKLCLNTIGGTNWSQIGQWISWEVEVPEDGLYEIDIKYRQNTKQGVTVSRALAIDGEVPFEEARELYFLYKNDWCMLTPGNGDEAYRFYMTAGTHTITLEVTLGQELSEILRMTDESVYELNRAYRLLLMVIGSSPDTMRDYQLEKKTPEALQILAEQYEAVQEISKKLESYSKGSKGSDGAAIDNLLNQLARMSKEPETIAKQWGSFKDNIVALSSWALGMKEQPLEIDYIIVASPGAELPKVEANFFQKLWHEIVKFFASFVEDYDSIGEVYADAIEVWILADAGSVSSVSGSGRDQANIIKTMVDNYFVPETGIPVNIKLVNKDVLLSATLAGTGPDVALNVAGKEPVNYALRNAVADLTQFEDYEEVTTWFHEEAMTQFTYDGGVYALPQTMSFHVMFYRADILKELGAKVPTNWDEFYETLAIIQKNNMNVGVFPDYTTYAMFLYQHGGEFYAEEGKRSGLDSEEAIAAFQMWSGNYANYRMPITFDFANRFRTGEMPLAIGDYTNYNYLTVFAPEIKGLWGFTVVPAYVDENGNENRSVSAWETASIIMETSDQKENAWEFLKWWMSAETQSNYGNDIENVLGVAGRVATANLEALESLPWSSNDYGQLKAQMEWVKAIPEVPGGYFTERNIKFAFYTVYNSQEDARETLENYVKTINNEIENKRKEFNLELD